MASFGLAKVYLSASLSRVAVNPSLTLAVWQVFLGIDSNFKARSTLRSDDVVVDVSHSWKI